MRHSLLYMIFAMLTALPGQIQAQAICRTDFPWAEQVVNSVRNLVTNEEDDVADFRTATQLNIAADTAVVLVADDAICQSAERAYRTVMDSIGVTPTGRVIVVRAGDRYVVTDPDATAGQGADLRKAHIKVVLSLAFDVLARFFG